MKRARREYERSLRGASFPFSRRRRREGVLSVKLGQTQNLTWRKTVFLFSPTRRRRKELSHRRERDGDPRRAATTAARRTSKTTTSAGSATRRATARAAACGIWVPRSLLFNRRPAPLEKAFALSRRIERLSSLSILSGKLGGSRSGTERERFFRSIIQIKGWREGALCHVSKARIGLLFPI